MAIWPWRTRPTVQPWLDSYNVTSTDLQTGLTPIHPFQIIPDNIYAQPLLLRVVVTNVAGVRVNQFISWDIQRAGRIICNSSFHVNTTVGTIAITYAVTYVGYFFATAPLYTIGYLPDHLHLLPADTFTLHVTGGLAGDTLDLCTITTKFWEIY
jgi:hypothetical protein